MKRTLYVCFVLAALSALSAAQSSITAAAGATGSVPAATGAASQACGSGLPPYYCQMPTDNFLHLDPAGEPPAAFMGPIAGTGTCYRDASSNGIPICRVTDRRTCDTGGCSAGDTHVASSAETVLCNHQVHPVCVVIGNGLEFYQFYPEHALSSVAPSNNPAVDPIVRLDCSTYPNYGCGGGLQADVKGNTLIADGFPWSFQFANRFFNATKAWPICLLYEGVNFSIPMTSASLTPIQIPNYSGNPDPFNNCQGFGLDISAFYNTAPTNGNAWFATNNVGSADVGDQIYAELFGIQQDQDHAIIAYNPATGAKRYIDLLTGTVGGDCGPGTSWTCAPLTVLGNQNNYPSGSPAAPTVTAINSSACGGAAGAPCLAQGDALMVGLTYATNKVGESNLSALTPYNVPNSAVCTASADHGGALPCNDLLITSPPATPGGLNFTLTHYNKYVQDVTRGMATPQLQAGGATLLGTPTALSVQCQDQNNNPIACDGSLTLGFRVIANGAAESSTHATGIPSALLTSSAAHGVSIPNNFSNSKKMVVSFTGVGAVSYTLLITDAAGNPIGYPAGACGASSCTYNGQALTNWAEQTEKIGTNGTVGVLATSSFSAPSQSFLGMTSHNVKVGMDACWIRIDGSPTQTSLGYRYAFWNICTNTMSFMSNAATGQPAGQSPGGNSHQCMGFNYMTQQLGSTTGSTNWADIRATYLVSSLAAIPWPLNQPFSPAAALPPGSFGRDIYTSCQLQWTTPTNSYPVAFDNDCQGTTGNCPTGGPHSNGGQAGYDYPWLSPWESEVAIYNPMTGRVYRGPHNWTSGPNSPGIPFWAEPRGGFSQLGDVFILNTDWQRGAMGTGFGFGNGTANNGITQSGTTITVVSSGSGQVDSLTVGKSVTIQIAPTDTSCTTGANAGKVSPAGTYTVATVDTVNKLFTVASGTNQSLSACGGSTASYYSPDCSAQLSGCNVDVVAVFPR